MNSQPTQTQNCIQPPPETTPSIWYEDPLETINIIFRSLPAITCSANLGQFKLLLTAINDSLTVAVTEEHHKMVLQLTLTALPFSVLFNYIHSTFNLSLPTIRRFLETTTTTTTTYLDDLELSFLDDLNGQTSKLNLGSLIQFLKHHIRGLEFVESFVGEKQKKCCDDQENQEKKVVVKVTKETKKAKKKSKPKHLEAFDDELEDDDDDATGTDPFILADHEIIIKGRLSGRRVSLLLDTGAVKSIVPVALFPCSELSQAFESASGHTIQASSLKKAVLEINGKSIPIKTHIGSVTRAVLGMDFLNKCSWNSDGQYITEIKYHDGGGSKRATTIYKRSEAAKKQKRSRSTSSLLKWINSLVSSCFAVIPKGQRNLET